MGSVMAEGFEPIKTDEDVEEILRLAVRNTGTGGESLRDRLKVSATELGISDEALAEAENLWKARKQGEISREQEQEERKLFRKMRIGDFITHFGTYAAINGFLFFIDSRKGGIDWAFWPLFGWGIAIVIHLFTLFAHGEEQEAEFLKWQKKRRKRKS